MFYKKSCCSFIAGILLLVNIGLINSRSLSPDGSASSGNSLVNRVIECGRKFHCVQSNQCIFHSWRCDNVTDCSFGEDEVNCGNNTCPEGYHRCTKTGQCVPHSWICEGSFVCPGHSGKLPCDNFTCSEGKFKCTNGRCIPNYLICDGDNDCDQGEDETLEMCQDYCSSSLGKYLCLGDKKCISTMSRCDVIVDCPQGDDELDCPTPVD